MLGASGGYTTTYSLYYLLVEPYQRFQRDGHLKKKNGLGVVASLMLVTCLVVEIIQHRIFAFADPLWPCIKDKFINASMSIIYIYICHALVYRHAKFECHSLNIVRDVATTAQVKHLSSWRLSCDLEWRSRPSDWQKIKIDLSSDYLHSKLFGIAWTVSEIIEHFYCFHD